MLELGSDHIYRAPGIARLKWVEHGFGTRHAAPPASLATLHQVHSAVCIDAGGRTGRLGDGDALLSAVPGVMVGVRTADCVPILLADEKLRVVAAVHAGWRGTVQRIAARAVEALRERFGSRPADLYAAIGPAIGACCFEVGPEVAAEFGVSGRAHIDLPERNRLQLLAAGVAENRIDTAGLCTKCRPAEFHSFRRDRERAGRMISAIGVRAAVE